MITYSEAVRRLMGIDPIELTETLSLADAEGRVASEELRARIDSPRFDNSAMDGFAIRAADLKAFQTLRVHPTTRFAGQVDDGLDSPLEAGMCIRIMTGAKLPDWCDKVIPVELAQLTSEGVQFEGVGESSHIRKRGEDFETGAPLIGAGERLSIEQLMVLASAGVAEVRAFKMPEVTIVTSGDEVVEIGERLAESQIYNCNKLFLTGSCKKLGLDVQAMHVLDDPALVVGQLTRILGRKDPQLILTTGAVSAGTRDFFPSLARDLGCEIGFHKVSIRPGKPILWASKNQHQWFGLPGNPISTVVGWNAFVLPFLKRWARVEIPSHGTAKLEHDVKKPESFRCFFRAQATKSGVKILRNQGSAMLKGSLRANCLAVLSENKDNVVQGEKIEIIPFDRGTLAFGDL